MLVGRPLATVLALALLGGSSDAEDITSLTAAERAEQAKLHFELGRAHHQLGHYAEAVQEFELAYLHQPLPLFLFDIGQSHRRAGNAAKAAEFYRRFLETAPEGAERNEALAYQAEAPPAPPPPPPSSEPVGTARSGTAGVVPVGVGSPSPRRWLVGVLTSIGALVVAGIVVAVAATSAARDPMAPLGTYPIFR